MKGSCHYCGKESGNVKMHERYCKSKPVEPCIPPTIQEIKDIGLMPHDEKLKEIRKPSFWDRFSSKHTTNPKQEPKQAKVEDILQKLPKWSIKQRKPFSKPKKPNANWIQIVAFSRTRPPVACWAEYDGVSISVGDMFFPAPHDIRGEIFPYDMDKGIPLLENSDPFNDMSYWNKLVERVKNMYFTLGLVTGSGDFTKNIGLILLLVAIVGLLAAGNLYLTYQLSQSMTALNSQVQGLTEALNPPSIILP